MSDQRLRSLERHWLETRDTYGLTRYINEWSRVHMGDEFHFRVLRSGLFRYLGPNAQGVDEYEHAQTGIVMFRVPAGSFRMGSNATSGRDMERPIRTVTFARPFLMGKYTVTQQQWTQMMGTNPSNFQASLGQGTDGLPPAEGNDQPWERHPADSVSWDDCQAFCNKTRLRLPTEAMWEYACRAGATTRYHFGNGSAELRNYAWFGYDYDDGHRAVGLKKPNAWGGHDFHGNVFEWCEDVWHDSYANAPENGFDAWDGRASYNVIEWRNGSVLDLINSGHACGIYEPQESDIDDALPVENRLTGYGINAPIREEALSVFAAQTLNQLGQPNTIRVADDCSDPTKRAEHSLSVDTGLSSAPTSDLYEEGTGSEQNAAQDAPTTIETKDPSPTAAGSPGVDPEFEDMSLGLDNPGYHLEEITIPELPEEEVPSGLPFGLGAGGAEESRVSKTCGEHAEDTITTHKPGGCIAGVGADSFVSRPIEKEDFASVGGKQDAHPIASAAEFLEIFGPPDQEALASAVAKQMLRDGHSSLSITRVVKQTQEDYLAVCEAYRQECRVRRGTNYETEDYESDCSTRGKGHREIDDEIGFRVCWG